MLSQEKNHVMTCREETGNRGGAWRSREWPKRIHFMAVWDPFYSVAGTSCAKFTWRPSSEPNSSLQKPSFELFGKLAEETIRVQDKQSLYMCTGRIFTFVVEKRGCRHPNRSSIL
ncbi:unnamed protein product [Musa acuminata var. zebrina]